MLDFDIVDSSGNLEWGLIHLVQEFFGQEHTMPTGARSVRPKKYVEILEIKIGISM